LKLRNRRLKNLCLGDIYTMLSSSIDEQDNNLIPKLGEEALKLYDIGFNIIAVDSGKKPLCSWSSRQRLEKEQLLQLLDKASGIAIVGGAENPWKPVAVLAIIDVDNPNILERKHYIKSIINSTVSWKTGARCIRCGSKHVKRIENGEKLRCGECGYEFDLYEAKRGIGALITVDNDVAERYFKGTTRFKDIEILVNNYALIPPSIHPSGIRYEWINPFNFNEPSIGIRPLMESEVAALLQEIGVLKKDVDDKEIGFLRETSGGEVVEEEELRELSDSELLKIKQLLKNAYKPGSRQYIWLFLSGWGAKAGISPISIAKALKILYDEANDNDPLKTRLGAVVYSYKKAGIDIDRYASEFEKLFSIKPYGLEKEVNEREIRGKTGIQEILNQLFGEERALEIVKELEEIFQGKIVKDLSSKTVSGKPRLITVKIAFELAKQVVERYNVKVPVVDDTVLGVYCYEDNAYVECEEKLLGEVQSYYTLNRLDEKGVSIRTLKAEFLSHIKDLAKIYRGFDHHLLLFRNGIFNWRGFEDGDSPRVEPSPEYMILHRIDHEIDWEIINDISCYKNLEKCIEAKNQFFRKVFQDWVGDRWILLYEIIGYTLYTNGYPYSKAIMLVGEGSNGKSTYLALLKSILGSRNITSITLQEISNDKFAGSQLFGKMANIYADLPNEMLKQTGKFKILTGEDYTCFDRKYSIKRICFTNYAKLIFSCNTLPVAQDTSYAFWRRWIVVEFPNQFPDNPKFKEEVIKSHEIPSLIALSILAFRRVMERGKFSFQEEALDYREVWMRRVEPVYDFIRFLEEKGYGVRKKDGRVDEKELYEIYTKYHEMYRDDAALPKKTFTERLESYGIFKKRTSSKRYYTGIALLKPREVIVVEMEKEVEEEKPEEATYK